MVATRKYSKEIATRIEKLIADPLVTSTNHWTATDFLPSLLRQFTSRGSLSERQYAVLIDIEDQFTGERRLKAQQEVKVKADDDRRRRADWEQYYLSDEVQEKAKLVAQYYKQYNKKEGTSYFIGTVADIFEGKIPIEKTCRKMLTNPFALSVIREWEKVPPYPVKSFVQARKRLAMNERSSLYGVNFAFVVKVNSSIPAAVKGGKKYLIFCPGKTGTIECEERNLKPYRKNKKK